tara:strand:- start:1672 stop:2379 length:708 start_codon:yes stop_codon:yes gene_type:complete
MKLYPIFETLITSNDEYKVDAYMNGTISEVEFFNGLEQLNEDVGDKLINFIGKMLTKLQSYFGDVAKYGKKLGKALNWLVEKTKVVYDKHPNLIKALVILSVMVALTMVSTAAVAAGGEPINIDPEYLNIVLGYADETNVDLNSLAMLIDAKDGVVDGKDWDANDIKTTFEHLRREMAETLNNMKAKGTPNGGIYTLLDMFKEMGDKLVGYAIETGFDSEGNQISKTINIHSKLQ